MGAEDNSQDQVFAFCHEHPESRTQVIRLGASTFNPLSHLISPSETVFKIIHPWKRHKLKSGGNKGLCPLPAKKDRRDKLPFCVR